MICWLGVIPLQPKLTMEANTGFIYIPVREIPKQKGKKKSFESILKQNMYVIKGRNKK